MNFLGVGPIEILVILAVTLIAFGPQRLPELARHVAKFMKMMRDASNELQKQLDSVDWEASEKKKNSHSYTHPKDDTEYAKGSFESAPDGTSAASSTIGDSSSETSHDPYGYGPTADSSSASSSESASIAEPQPQPISDPAKVDDAQRYAREMTD